MPASPYRWFARPVIFALAIMLTFPVRMASAADPLADVRLWQKAVALYESKQDKDSLTRVASYFGRIAPVFDQMGYFAEAEGAYRAAATAWLKLGQPRSARAPSLRADEIRTELVTYMRVPATAPTITLAKHEPADGIYLGIVADANPRIGAQSITKIASFFGKQHAYHLTYVPWGQNVSRMVINWAKGASGGLQVAWEPDKGLDSVADDAYVRSVARTLGASGLPVLLRFASEMNGDWTAWNGNPAQYRQAFQTIARVMREEAPNVAMVWAPNFVPEETIEEYYPGDEWVDWVGVNFYTDRYYLGDPGQPATVARIYRQGDLSDPLDHLKYVYQKYSARKPIMIAETGVSGYNVKNAEDLSRWAANNIERLYGYLPLVYPRVKAIFYFDVERSLVKAGAGMWANYSLVQSDLMLAAYKRGIQSQSYLSSPEVSLGLPYAALDRLSARTNVPSRAGVSVQLATYTHLPVPVTEYVEYRVDGVLAGRVKGAPFETTLSLPEGSHAIDIRAFSGGAMRARRTHSVTILDGQLRATAGPLIAPPYSIRLADISGSWAKREIEAMASAGYVKGYPDGTFRPAAQITRAEFYAMLAASLGLPKGSGATQVPGIAGGHWAQDILAGAIEQRIIQMNRYPGLFPADAAVSRGEMAEWTVKALDVAFRSERGTGDSGMVDDSEIPEWQRTAVARATALGVIRGYEDGTFRANAPATRSEALVVVKRALDFVEEAAER